MLKCFQLLRNDKFLPTALLLNQILSIFQTNWSFIHMRKLTLWLYYNLLMLPKVIHFVNYMWHVQTQMCSSCFCTFYLQICYNTIFHTITGEADVGCAYSALGNEKSKALLGAYAFNGCDLTRRISGFSKTTCFDRFLKSNSIVHEVFAP